MGQRILVVDDEEGIVLLLKDYLELQGYDVVDSINPESPEQPGIIILDSNDDMSGLDLCKDLKNMTNFVNTKIIVTTTVHDKTAVLNSGADLYLPKPYEISDLIQWVEYFIKSNKY